MNLLQSMKVNVLHIIDKYSYGGVETIIFHLMNRYTSDKYDLSYYFLRDLKTKNKLERENVYIRDFHKHSLFRPLIDLLRVIKKDEISIIHTHHKKGFYLGCIISLINRKIKFIHHEHGDVLVNNPVYLFFLKIIKSRINLIIAVSEHNKKTLIKKTNINQNKINVLSNFVDLSQVKKQISVKTNEGSFIPRIGFVGRLSAVKGCEYFILAIKSIINEYPNAQFYIAGDGEMKDDLHALTIKLGVEKNVIFLGRIDDFSFIADTINLLVIPSESEASPMVLFEAWAYEIPVIISDLPSLKGVVFDQKNALLFPVGNIEKLTYCIKKIVSDISFRNSITVKAFQDVGNYSLEMYIKKLSTQYDLATKKILS